MLTSNEPAPTDTGIRSMAASATDVASEDRRVGSLRIHVAHATSGTHGGVLLYPTIMGLDDTMRECARVLASAGMTAVVWDPYDGEDGNGEVPEMLARSRRCEDPRVVEDLVRIVDHMVGELGIRMVGGIGWCFGGRLGLLHAGEDPRVGVLASYNPTIWSPTPVDINGRELSRADFPGQTMDEFAAATRIRGPVQVSRPEHDFTRPAEYQRLVDALSTRPDPTFYEYHPGADHGFSYTPGAANLRAHRFAWSATLSLLKLTFEEA
jgi:carboxymethylenebutenolidase